MQSPKSAKAKRCAALVAAIVTAGLAASPGADAARRGSSVQYPVGITMGTPTGALLPPGWYLIDKPTYSTSRSVNNAGDATGAHSTVWTNNAQLYWAPGVQLLGADYAAFVRNIGAVNISFTAPNGVTTSHTGLPDTDLVPINLSWKLPNHLFFDAELGIYVPDGSYSSNPGSLNVGQNAWTVEPNFALSYLDKDWALTAHAVFDINGKNSKAAVIGGQDVGYTNGTTLVVDYTAFHKTGPWSYGLVGYSLNQLGSDSGPAALNGGRPAQIAAGAGAGYDFGRVKLTGSYTEDVYARNVGKKKLFLLIFNVKLF